MGLADLTLDELIKAYQNALTEYFANTKSYNLQRVNSKLAYIEREINKRVIAKAIYPSHPNSKHFTHPNNSFRLGTITNGQQTINEKLDELRETKKESLRSYIKRSRDYRLEITKAKS